MENPLSGHGPAPTHIFIAFAGAKTSRSVSEPGIRWGDGLANSSLPPDDFTCPKAQIAVRTSWAAGRASRFGVRKTAQPPTRPHPVWSADEGAIATAWAAPRSGNTRTAIDVLFMRGVQEFQGRGEWGLLVAPLTHALSLSERNHCASRAHLRPEDIRSRRRCAMGELYQSVATDCSACRVMFRRRPGEPPGSAQVVP